MELKKNSSDKHLAAFVCAGLVVMTLASFWKVIGNSFVAYDDRLYLIDNPAVQNGLGLSGIQWAFTHNVAGNWHPITILSHMLDCSFFGLNPAGHHVINLLLHIANVLLLFLLLWSSTRRLWPSALVAALFAIHPLHVESVAWIAERKDVLSGFFFFLTLLAYVGYVRAKGEKAGALSASSNRLVRHPSLLYGLALVSFALGLMSKPMLVTVPCVLLLLDYWPLGRWQPAVLQPQAKRKRVENHVMPVRVSDGGQFGRLFLEKVPFFLLSAASSVITVIAQRQGGAVVPFQVLPFEARLQNAAVAYLVYLEKMVWPVNLAVFYPCPMQGWPVWRTALGVLIVLAASVLAIRLWQRRTMPFVTVGWFWFAGTLVPVLGLIQVGAQAYADRYTYLPLIGCFILVAWTAAHVAANYREQAPRLWPLAGIVLIALALCTRAQVAYWRNSVALFERCLAATKDNFVAHSNLAVVLSGEGKFDEAKTHCLEALRIYPQSTVAMGNLAAVLAMQGDYDGAKARLAQAVQLEPDSAGSYGKIALGLSLHGKLKEAVVFYREYLRLKPDDDEACNNLAWILAAAPDPTVRDGPRAVEFGERACSRTGYRKAVYIGTLAAAYAEAGRFADATATAEKAIATAEQAGQEQIANRNRELLALYRSGKPFHEKQAPSAHGS